ncbi:MAG TPA: carboxypeptidase-like regulatory domain-containing protein, partial [Gemmataceae bacterium]|nr:carboxypeptidase-like regulatory domain-containing protein [Gemmataceae bacterium]
MLRWSKGKNHRRPSAKRGSFFKPVLEMLEDRRLLSVGANLQGTVVDDSNNDAPLAGATVSLLDQAGNPVPGQS